MKANTLACAIYTRKSSEEGLEQDFNSLDAQREACAAYILSQKALGWSACRETYDDGGFSGGTLDRPALKQLISDIEAGLIDVIVVYKIDRLSRSLMDFAKLVEVFDRVDVAVGDVRTEVRDLLKARLELGARRTQFGRELQDRRLARLAIVERNRRTALGDNAPLSVLPNQAQHRRHDNETNNDSVLHDSTLGTRTPRAQFRCLLLRLCPHCRGE